LNTAHFGRLISCWHHPEARTVARSLSPTHEALQQPLGVHFQSA
jgi:hypothetical protein